MDKNSTRLLKEIYDERDNKRLEIINNLKNLWKEYNNLWEYLGDDVSPKIINNAIKFIELEYV